MTKSLSKTSPSRNLLTQIITNNQLVKSIQSLEPAIIGKIIHHIGLEDSGELLMLLTSSQLQEAMDKDTWSSEKLGADETLDARRFCTWLEVLLEVSPAFAAEKVSEMDEDLLTSVLHQFIMAMESDELALMTRTSEDDFSSESKYLDKVLESTFNLEIDDYLVMSRTSSQWEPLSLLLVSLQKDHSDLLERILSRIRASTLDLIEEHDGLYNLLSESEMWDNDVRHEREERREKEGFVTVANSTAFFKLIHQISLEDLIQSQEMDPISRMYFRTFRPVKPNPVPGISDELLELLKSYGITPQQPPRTLKLQAPMGTTPGIRTLLMELQKSNEDLFREKLSILNFVANVLMSGHGVHKKRLRPIEAMDLAIEICDLGLQYARGKNLPALQKDILKLFKVGWKLKTF